MVRPIPSTSFGLVDSVLEFIASRSFVLFNGLDDHNMTETLVLKQGKNNASPSGFQCVNDYIVFGWILHRNSKSAPNSKFIGQNRKFSGSFYYAKPCKNSLSMVI
jgi:hypothetical protein